MILVIFFTGADIIAARSLPLANPDRLIYRPLHFKYPRAERAALNNGMILYILEDHELPLVNIHIAIKTGSYYDPEGKEGLAELTGTVMKTGGTETTTGSAIDEELESLAINIKISTQTESAAVSFSGLKNNLDRGLGILSQVMMRPVFAEDKLQLAKNLKTEELRRIADDPQQLAFREFNRVFYSGDPRGRLASPRSLRNIVRDDLRGFHGKFFTPDNMMVAVTGDVTKNEILGLFAKYFGGWQTRGKALSIPPPAPVRKEAIYYLSKDTPQSVIITGQFAPAKKSPDFYAFTLLDFILGSGGFRSRIFQEIRTNQGLAYSAGSFYRAKSDYGVFGAYAMTKSASTGKVLTLLRDISGKAKNSGFDTGELNWAKNSINNSFVFSFSSTEQTARQQMMLEFDKLPDDYLITYPEKIKNVSAEDLKRIALKYLSPEEITTLVAGKEMDFDKPLSSFGKVDRIKVNND